MNSEEPRKIIERLVNEKAVLKQNIYDNTFYAFKKLKSFLRSFVEELKKSLPTQESRVMIEYKDKGDFEAEIKVGGDTLIFLMHTNIFNFERDHIMWKTPYVLEDQTKSYCGMICVYNFLSDSLKYNRPKDIGYLIARIFVNREMHFFVEGKRQLGFLYNDYTHMILDDQKIKDVVESAVIYCLDFDLYTPPYDEMKEVSVQDIIDNAVNSQMTTGKRLGFRFQADSDRIE